MRILVDENIPGMTVGWLRELGHDVLDLRGTPAQGLEDQGLWGIALGEGRMLITTDRGFTEYRGADHAGILVVRLRQPNRLRIHRAVMLALGRILEDGWRGVLAVVRDHTFSVSRAGGPVERP